MLRDGSKTILKKNSYKIAQSKNKNIFINTDLLEVMIEGEDFENLVTIRNWEELVRDKIKSIIKEKSNEIMKDDLARFS